MKIPAARLLSWSTLLLGIVSVVFALNLFKKAQTAELPAYGPVPAFRLTDQNGAGFDSQSLAGKVWVGAFMFTRCPDACPLMVLKLAKISKANPGLHFVSFTSDPDFDKPEILNEYVKRGVGPANWTYLTGEKADLEKIAAGLLISAPENPNLHSTRFILADQSGRIRGFYDSQSREQLAALAVDSRALTR